MGGISTDEDARQLNLAGFNLVLPSGLSPSLRKALYIDGVAYIDKALGRLGSAHKPQATKRCTSRPFASFPQVTRRKSQRMPKSAWTKLKPNPNLAGFWILDDYPQGEITSVLKTLHDLVHAVGASVRRESTKWIVQATARVGLMSPQSILPRQRAITWHPIFMAHPLSLLPIWLIGLCVTCSFTPCGDPHKRL
jgi:hypothetical protein